ncbi:MAG: DUF4150 domain-containing protein [Polyangiaceae bacterium]
MLAKTTAGGMCMAFPDVCLTPTPAPVPIPYPNMTFHPMSVLFVPNVLVTCAPAHNMLTMAPLSVGDNTGVALGVASGMVMGPQRNLTGAFTVIVGCAPMTRLTSLSLQNSTNTVGAAIVPSVTTVLVLSP